MMNVSERKESQDSTEQMRTQGKGGCGEGDTREKIEREEASSFFFNFYLSCHRLSKYCAVVRAAL